MKPAGSQFLALTAELKSLVINNITNHGSLYTVRCCQMAQKGYGQGYQYSTIQKINAIYKFLGTIARKSVSVNNNLSSATLKEKAKKSLMSTNYDAIRKKISYMNMFTALQIPNGAPYFTMTATGTMWLSNKTLFRMKQS